MTTNKIPGGGFCDVCKEVMEEVMGNQYYEISVYLKESLPPKRMCRECAVEFIKDLPMFEKVIISRQSNEQEIRDLIAARAKAWDAWMCSDEDERKAVWDEFKSANDALEKAKRERRHD